MRLCIYVHMQTHMCKIQNVKNRNNASLVIVGYCQKDNFYKRFKKLSEVIHMQKNQFEYDTDSYKCVVCIKT